MVSMSDELKERNILKLILIVRFACATRDVGHPIHATRTHFPDPGTIAQENRISAREKTPAPSTPATGQSK
jgi:hypothetical protein